MAGNFNAQVMINSDIELAYKLNADGVHLNSSHPNIIPIGWDGFSKVTQKYCMPVYALGGMKHDDVKKAFNAGGVGIASQRAIWET